MKNTTSSESKIFPQDNNSNRKKDKSGGAAIASGGSLLKRNEFTMILIAALVVTALVFFFFFRGSSPQHKGENGTGSAGGPAQAAPGFEDRISALEVSMGKLVLASNQDGNQAVSQVVPELDERITRIETAVNLKLDTLIERVDKLEGRLNKPVAVPVVSAPKPAAPAPKPAPEKKVQVTKKKPKKVKKKNQFHTVQKGETLWSISQKYKTNVAAIRKLNNLTPEDKIYPGSNLLVR